jgi:hypothetical protein
MTDGDSSDRNHRDIVTLRDYLEAQMKAIRDTMGATDRAMDVRLEAMNELRDQINRERGSYIPRAEHDAVHKSIEEQVSSLMMSRAEMHGKASMASVYWTGIVSFMSLLLAVISIVVTLIGH